MYPCLLALHTLVVDNNWERSKQGPRPERKNHSTRQGSLRNVIFELILDAFT